MKKLIIIISYSVYFFFFACIAFASDKSYIAYSYDCYAMALDVIKEGNDYDKAREILSLGLETAPDNSEIQRKLVWAKGIAYYYEAIMQNIARDFDRCYGNYDNALKCFSRIKSTADEVSVICKMAHVNASYFNNYSLAIEQYESAKVKAAETGDIKGVFDITESLVDLYDLLMMREPQNKLALQLHNMASYSNNPELKKKYRTFLGKLAIDNGNLLLAKSIFLDMLRMEPDKPYFIYNNLRTIAYDEGDYEKALDYTRVIIDIYAESFKDNAAKRYTPYIQMAFVYSKLNDRENCFRCMDSLFVCNNYPITDIERGGLYHYRGWMHNNFGEYAEALEDFKIAQDIYTGMRTDAAHGDLESNTAMQAIALFNLKRYSESKERYMEYAGLIKEHYGDFSMQYAEALNLLANIEGFNGEFEDGSRHYMESVGMLMEIAKRDLPKLPSSARDKYWEQISRTVWDMSGYGIKGGFVENEFTAAAYDALLFSKGLLLASEKSLETIVYDTDDEDIISDYRNMMSLRKRVTDFEAAGNMDVAMRVYAELNGIDQRLANNLTEYSTLPLRKDVSFVDIVEKLKPDEAVVDFTDYTLDNGERQFVAYVLTSSCKYPKLVHVVNGNALDSLLSLSKGRYDYMLDYYSDALERMVWKPVEDAMAGAERVYLVPSGDLHHLPVESIITADGRTLNEKFDIVRLTSATEVLSYDDTGYLNSPRTARLYGGLKYGANMSDMDSVSSMYVIPPEFALRGADIVYGDSIFRELAFSMEEVSSIARILSERGIAVSVLCGEHGTEESFIAMSGNAPDILQISTHGFYYDTDESCRTKGLSGYRDIMFLSGLVMAGGNTEWLGNHIPEGRLGGLLTSDDISKLNLDSVQLVVLSACETGLGKATNEGLYGLQRAFKKAGVQTMVMSLWPVSDLVTKEFMVEFYRNLSENGWNKRKAFNDAVCSIRERRNEPFYWAGFVMVD